MESAPELKVSVSQLKCWLRCPEQYRLRYCRGVEPAFVPLALAFGSCVHTALAFHYGTIKTSGSAPSLDALQQIFADAWDAALEGPVPLQVDEEGEDLGKQVDKGIEMMAAFYRHAASAPLPVVDLVEHAFTVDVYDPETGEVLEEKLAGVIDLVLFEDGHRTIVEHKSSARKYSLDQLRFDIQPTAYAFAAQTLGWGEVGLMYQVLTKTKTPSIQVENIHRDEADHGDFLRTATGVLRAIDAGAFFPIRGWQCRSCPYAHACTGGRSP